MSGRLSIAGSQEYPGCQSMTAQFERVGPLLQVALTLIEQTVGVGHARDSGSGLEMH